MPACSAALVSNFDVAGDVDRAALASILDSICTREGFTEMMRACHRAQKSIARELASGPGGHAGGPATEGWIV